MKNRCSVVAGWCVLAKLLCGPLLASASHQLSDIRFDTNGAVVLGLEGFVASTNVFRNFFDIVPVQGSPDFSGWSAIATLLRTNLTSNVVSFSDPLPLGGPRQFFRASQTQWHTPFRKPTGSFGVGMTERLITDRSRSNRFGYPTNSSFMLTCWYPAALPPEASPAPYMHPLLASNQSYWPGQAARTAAFVSHATADAPVAAGAGLRLPIILYSHGLGSTYGLGSRKENTERAVELSSHGYVVISLDHTDTFGTVLPGDRLLLGKLDAFSDTEKFHTNRLADINFVLDQLPEINRTDPLLASHLDLDHVGIMGWSFGGGVAADSLRLNANIQAAALLDGFLTARPDLLKGGVQKPLLAACSPSSGLYGDNFSLYVRSSQNQYLLQIKDTVHESFTDYSWTFQAQPANRSKAAAIDRCVVSFFNKHLFGVDDGLLDNPMAVIPEVILFKKK